MTDILTAEAFAILKAQREGGVIIVNDADNFECVVCGAVASYLFAVEHALSCYVATQDAELDAPVPEWRTWRRHCRPLLTTSTKAITSGRSSRSTRRGRSASSSR